MGPQPIERADVEPMERVDAEHMAFTALRDVLMLGRQKQVTYPEAMAEGAKLFPDLLSQEKSILFRAMEKPVIRAFREKASAASIQEEQEITPREIVEREMKGLAELIRVSTGSTKDMMRELSNLRDCLVHFIATAESESAILTKDVFQSDRPLLPCAPTTRGRCQEYDLGKGRHLHIRMLHPDKAEHVCGADVIYEVCSPTHDHARIAFAQYKIWDRDRIAWSKINPKQIARMEKCLCQSKMCKPTGSNAGQQYRMPCCSAFLRLTRKVQDPSSRLISAGHFIPICQLPNQKRGTLELSDLECRTLSSDLFEAAFVEGVAGSDWLTFQHVESLYRRTKIFESHDRIVIHAQEF